MNSKIVIVIVVISIVILVVGVTLLYIFLTKKSKQIRFTSDFPSPYYYPICLNPPRDGCRTCPLWFDAAHDTSFVTIHEGNVDASNFDAFETIFYGVVDQQVAALVKKQDNNFGLFQGSLNLLRGSMKVSFSNGVVYVMYVYNISQALYEQKAPPHVGKQRTGLRLFQYNVFPQYVPKSGSLDIYGVMGIPLYFTAKVKIEYGSMINTDVNIQFGLVLYKRFQMKCSVLKNDTVIKPLSIAFGTNMGYTDYCFYIEDKTIRAISDIAKWFSFDISNLFTQQLINSLSTIVRDGFEARIISNFPSIGAIVDMGGSLFDPAQTSTILNTHVPLPSSMGPARSSAFLWGAPADLQINTKYIHTGVGDQDKFTSEYRSGDYRLERLSAPFNIDRLTQAALWNNMFIPRVILAFGPEFLNPPKSNTFIGASGFTVPINSLAMTGNSSMPDKFDFTLENMNDPVTANMYPKHLFIAHTIVTPMPV